MERTPRLLALLFTIPFLVIQPEQQCFLDAMSKASSTVIRPPAPKSEDWRFSTTRPAKRSRLKFLLKHMKEEDGSIDSRLLALSWMESRMRIGVTRGDRGKACGIFQIHARYSYPMFRRKRGFVGWVESEEANTISAECRRLERTAYSISTMRKYLGFMDHRELHPCHHNSGHLGQCNTWYKQRLNYWLNYFNTHQVLCDRRVQTVMAMMRTGNPIPTAPAPLMQGYLDSMGGKEPALKDSVYMSGYELANLVKEGKAQPPSWAVEAPTEGESSGEG